MVKLLDFGLAKQLRVEEPVRMTQAGTMLGTPLYMSPERLRGEPHDGRADVYSIGVLLYEMLTGMLPFSDRSSAELLVQQLTCDPPPLRARCAEVPLSIEQVVLSALHRDPEKRPCARELLLLWQSACPGWPHRPAHEPTTELFRPVVSAQAQTVEIPSIMLDLKLDALEL